MQLPWNVVLLLLLHSVFFYMLAHPVFAIAVFGQIFMGTVYVFLEQALHECFLIYGQGNLPLYRKIKLAQAVAYNSGLVAPGMSMTFVYSELGRTIPFLIMSGLTLSIALCFLVFFACRLCPTGLAFGGLLAAETKILQSNAPIDHDKVDKRMRGDENTCFGKCSEGGDADENDIIWI